MRISLVRQHRIVLLLLWVLAVLGCTSWQRSAGNPSVLPPTRMSPDAVVLEIAFVRLPTDSVAEQTEIWHAADEQLLAPDLRRRLQENGLRAGIVGSQLPAVLRGLLEQRADPLLASGDVTASQRQLQSIAGKRGVIQTGPLQPNMTLLLHENGKVAGQQLLDAQCLFAVRTFPQGDGRVRMEFIPEVEYGQPRQQYVGRDGAFLFEPRKDAKVIDSLKMELLLSPGDVLLVSSTAEQKGLGKQFFAEGASGEQKVLMVRLAQTQFDDLFAPEFVQEPLVTPYGE
jgi:hypothetical protein